MSPRSCSCHGFRSEFWTARDRIDSISGDEPNGDEEIEDLISLIETIPKQVRGFAGVQVSAGHAELIAADATAVATTLTEATDVPN